MTSTKISTETDSAAFNSRSIQPAKLSPIEKENYEKKETKEKKIISLVHLHIAYYFIFFEPIGPIILELVFSLFFLIFYILTLLVRRIKFFQEKRKRSAISFLLEFLILLFITYFMWDTKGRKLPNIFCLVISYEVKDRRINIIIN